jgi:hypothetical protein
MRVNWYSLCQDLMCICFLVMLKSCVEATLQVDANKFSESSGRLRRSCEPSIIIPGLIHHLKFAATAAYLRWELCCDERLA